jgi:hypothetical protein
MMKMISNRKIAGHLFSKVVGILLLLALCASVMPPQAAQAETCKFKHKVQAGETLIGIGYLYQYDWRKIAADNDLKEPYILTAGQVLCIRGGTQPTSNTPGTGIPADDKKNKPTLTVVAGMQSVYVKMEHFSKFVTAFVSVRPKSDASPLWAPLSYDPRIGRLRTDKNGFFEGWFYIPDYIPRHYDMVLCLKDVVTDQLLCVDYHDTYYNLIPEELNCDKNSGR